MKKCPECGREYDNSMMFCLDDGAELLYGPARSEPGAIVTGFPADEPQTAILHSTAAPGEAPTRAQIQMTDQTAVLPTGTGDVAIKPRGFEKRLLLAPLALAVIVLGGFFGYRYITPAKQIESIAVMPFVNESKNEDVEYLSDGMTETLISSLTNLPNLNVKARSTVFRYKGKEADAKTIGKELNVQAILTGRVNQRGDQLTLSIELVDVTTENAIWSQQYSRKQSDLATLQADIARDVSNKLTSKLSTAEVAKVDKNSKVNAEAYQLYLKGLFQLNRRTAESIRQAADLFRQSIEKDPNYAPAYVGLGRTLLQFPLWSLAPPKASGPQAKAAALKALELDDSLAEPHVILGVYLSEYEWDWVSGEKEYRRAIDLNPNNPWTYAAYAGSLMALKRFDEAIAAGRREVELDPLSKRGTLTQSLYAAHRFDEAIAEIKAVIELDPTYTENYWHLGYASYGKGLYQEAAAAFQKYHEMDDEPWGRGSLAIAQAKAGNRKELTGHLNWLEQRSSRMYVPNSAFALVHIALGNKNEALTWLEKDVDERSGNPTVFSWDPMLEDVRGEPRFKALLKRMNLPE